MPTPGKRWRFVTISAHNSWKSGDMRGWRSRNHKRHSSGDYKHPPPPEEHAGLRKWVNDHSSKPVIIPRPLRKTIGEHIITVFHELGHRVMGISVSGMHAHILVELPDHLPTIRAIVGEAKRASSRAVKKQMPGKVWADGGDFDPVDSRAHATRALNYILTKQGPGAWTWSFRQPIPTVELHVKLKVRLPGKAKRNAK